VKARAFLGVDIGTTSIAAVIVDGRGRVVRTLSAPNPSAGEPTEDGRHEQNADAILATVNGLIKTCESFVRARKAEIVRIGWTGQMHGLVAVDRKLNALTPFVTWRDRRCAPPKLGSGILEDWHRRKVKGIYRALTIPGYVIARRTGRCVVDRTFRASMGTDAQLKRYAKWIPEADDSQMLGDNQAGVYAALKLKRGAAVVNIGTSGQLSVVKEERGENESKLGVEVEERRDKTSSVQPSTFNLQPDVSIRPFPGGRTLLCRASHVGGAPLAKLRKELGYSWNRLNAEAETHPRIAACVAAIVDDLAKGVDMKGVRTVVGVGNALRLNPCLRKAVEKKFRVRCVIPDVEEMAAWGAALYVQTSHLSPLKLSNARSRGEGKGETKE